MRNETYSIKDNNAKHILQIEKGGTGANTKEQALANLGALDLSIINTPGGVLGLDEKGLCPSQFLPAVLGTVKAVTLEGPMSVVLGGTIICKITNYDIFTTYTLAGNKVILNRDKDSIIVSGVTAGLDGWFSVNGSKFPIQVIPALTFLQGTQRFEVKTTGTSKLGKAFAANNAGNILIVSDSEFTNNDGVISGKAILYSAMETGLTELYNSSKDKLHGEVVTVSKKSETIGVGSPRNYNPERTDGGDVTFIFKNATTWLSQTITSELKSPYPYFGFSISIDDAGTSALIGAKGRNEVYYYTRTLITNFIEQSILAPNSLKLDAGFGTAISGNIDNTLIAISAPFQTDNGVIFIYERSGNVFNLKATLNVTLEGNVRLGNKLWMNSSGTKILANVIPSGFSDGVIIEFTKILDTWTETAQITSPLTQVYGTNFGKCFSISEDETTLAIGAPGSKRTAGTLNIFVKTNSGWNFSKTLTKLDGGVNDGYGTEVFLNAQATALIVGSYTPDSSFDKKGSIIYLT